jgi:hypothetical protein
MALVKHCNKCGKDKPTTEFSKSIARKDGLQQYCKACNKVDNLKFRTEINPEHHKTWQINNPGRQQEIISKYRKGDKPGLIYYIVNPNGEYYIGMTNTYLSVRLVEHKVKWKRWIEGKSNLVCPLLFDSISKWGWEAHKSGVIIEDRNATRKELREWEKQTIQFFKGKGISLNKSI